MSNEARALLLACILLMVHLSGCLSDTTVEDDGVHYGDVYGEFEPSGRIWSREVYADEKVSLRVLDAEDNATSSFFLRVWNISEVTVGDISHGEYFYHNYSLENGSFIVEEPGGFIVARVLHGTFDIEYEDVSIRNDEGWYRYHYHFSSINGTAVLGHQDGPYLDFQMLDVNVRIGNETVYLKEGKFGFPEDEHANIEVVARGHGVVTPIPTFRVNGSVSITDFRERTSDGRGHEGHDRFTVTSSNITVITREVPVTDVVGHTRYVIIKPWSIEVRT